MDILSRYSLAQRRKSAGAVGDLAHLLSLGIIPAAGETHPMAAAFQHIARRQLEREALGDVAKVGLTGLGVGAAGAGLAGLLSTTKDRKRKPSGPTVLPLPYPIEPNQMPTAVAGNKSAGDGITSKLGLPWYPASMLASGVGGLALGWKGVDSVIQAKAQRDRQEELEQAKQEFHDALIQQYDKPIDSPKLPKSIKGAADSSGENCPHCNAELERSEDGTCNSCGGIWRTEQATKNAAAELNKTLDSLFDKMSAALEKVATWDDIMGGIGGAYGVYAGTTGLLGGALAYNAMKKRSRRAILEKALKRRDRRHFAMSPTEIYAMPEPVERTSVPFKQEMSALSTTPGDDAVP